MNIPVSEIVRLLLVSERDVYRWIERDGLPAVRAHGDYQVHRAELFDWARQRGIRLPKRFFRAEPDAMAQLKAALDAGVVRQLPVPNDRLDAVDALISSLRLAEADAAVLVRIVASRASLGFTPVRDGIALPRVCEPLIVDAPAAVNLCWFEAEMQLSDLAARAFLVVTAPTIPVHRVLVEDLHAALDDDAFRAAVLAPQPLTVDQGVWARRSDSQAA